MNINRKLLIPILAIMVAGSGCKKDYLETAPSDQVAAEDLFKTTTSAYTALNGMHSFMTKPFASEGDSRNIHSDFGAKSWDLIDDMMGNDMVVANVGYENFQNYYRYLMQTITNSYGTATLWNYYYKIINNANNILDNIDGAVGPQVEKNDIKGQALAYRAYALLRLTTFYQFNITKDPNAPGLPIYTTATNGETKGNGRGTIQQTFDQITSDIEQAVTLLADVPPSSNKSNISLYAAQGIYARVALAKKDYTKAREMSIRAAQNFPLMTNDQYTAGFNLTSNGEWIWGSTLTSEQYASFSIVSFFSFMDVNTPGYASVGANRKITKALYDMIPTGDIRKNNFRSSDLIPTKFRVSDPSGFVGDYVFMRAAEMYLIEAEAKYHLGDAAGAKEALEDLVTPRFPTYSAPASGQALLNEILLQRRIELWGEGFAFTDIMRLQQGLNRPSGAGNHTAGFARLMTTPPNDNRMLYKIPQREVDASPAINEEDQNPF